VTEINTSMMKQKNKNGLLAAGFATGFAIGYIVIGGIFSGLILGIGLGLAMWTGGKASNDKK
jgi:hypothetical protein